MNDRNMNPQDALIGTSRVAELLGWEKGTVHVTLARARAARAAGHEHWFPEPAHTGTHAKLWRLDDITTIPPPAERRIGARPPARAGNRYRSRENNGRTIELIRTISGDGWIIRNVTHPDTAKIGNQSTISNRTLRRWHPVSPTRTAPREQRKP